MFTKTDLVLWKNQLWWQNSLNAVLSWDIPGVIAVKIKKIAPKIPWREIDRSLTSNKNYKIIKVHNLVSFKGYQISKWVFS